MKVVSVSVTQGKI